LAGQGLTRLAVLSDIHGNSIALEAVLADLARTRVDQIVIAGDIINWGPFSAQVVERIAREGWSVIRGNNEFYLLDYDTPRAPAEWSDPGQFPLIPWLSRQMNGRCRTIVEGWPDTLSLQFPDAPPLRVIHGSPLDNKESIFPGTPESEISAMFAGVEEETIVAAHTHIIMDRRVAGRHIVNPGSVGTPLDGLITASYMLLDGNAEGWRATLRRVDFNYAPLFAEFERQRFVEECGLIGKLVLEEFKTARLHVLPFIHWHMANCPEAPFAISLFEEFCRADRWAYTPIEYHVNV
jgi:predicted phosphodiesterase